MPLRNCLYCGKEYEAKTRRSRYCSDLCRSRARTAGFVISEPPRGAITEEGIARAVATLRGDAAFFDAASLKGPKAHRERCRAVAEGINDVLREAGL